MKTNKSLILFLTCGALVFSTLDAAPKKLAVKLECYSDNPLAEECDPWLVEKKLDSIGCKFSRLRGFANRKNSAKQKSSDGKAYAFIAQTQFTTQNCYITENKCLHPHEQSARIPVQRGAAGYVFLCTCDLTQRDFTACDPAAK